MVKNLTLTILLILFACTGDSSVAETKEASTATTNQTTSTDSQAQDQISIQNKKAITESLKITLVNKETGETRLARPDEIDLSIEEKERFKLLPAKPEQQVHIQKLSLRDAEGRKIDIPLDKVTLIEYWNEDSMESNQFWGKMREFERKYADSNEIQLLSIYHNPVYGGRELVAYGNQIVKKYELPKNLYFDTLANLPDTMYVPGGVSYLLIDHRRQMTHAGRGGFPACEQVFDAVDNALRFQRTVDPDQNVSVETVPNQ